MSPVLIGLLAVVSEVGREEREAGERGADGERERAVW